MEGMKGEKKETKPPKLWIQQIFFKDFNKLILQLYERIEAFN